MRYGIFNMQELPQKTKYPKNYFNKNTAIILYKIWTALYMFGFIKMICK